jgi:proton-dependent oligopeptide transporter, POT family
MEEKEIIPRPSIGADEAPDLAAFASSTVLPTVEKPSKEDEANLRRISDKIPTEAWLVAGFSGAERFAYYAMQVPLRMAVACATALMCC